MLKNKENLALVLIAIAFVLFTVAVSIEYARRIDEIENGNFALVSDSEMDR